MVLRDKLLNFAFRYQEVASDKVDARYAPNTQTTRNEISRKNANEVNENYTELNIDPTDQEGKELLYKTKISLNAALVLYDNYMVGIYPYYNSRKMRKLLNQDIKGYRFEFDKITDRFFDINQRAKIHKTIKLINQDFTYKEQEKIVLSDSEKYLDLLIQQSPFYNYMIEKYNPIADPSVLRVFADRIFDRSRFLHDYFTYTSSKIFGNTVGLVSFRKGLMAKFNSTEKAEIKANMKPLDILLEKTPFRLTDQFIPGYYGHVAIWAGREEELKELGVWEDPAVTPHHEAIRSGHFIIEALRPGVQINSLEHFLNIDDLLVLRDTSLTATQKKDFLIRAFSQIGKSYDFNFDVETDKKIVCSEIVYVVFHNIDWPTTKALGRHTISPDNVASKVFKGSNLTPVMMYFNGKKFDGDMKKELALKTKNRL